MKRESRSRYGMGWIAPLLMIGVLAGTVSAQSPDKAKPAAPVAAKTAKVRKKPRGRLPAYFSRVVTAKQREQIYSIQAKYNGQIKQLQQQIQSLVGQRDSEVEKVLSEEQRAEVEQLRAARKAKQAASKTARGKPAGGTSKG